MKNDWKDYAVCSQDKSPHKWLSSNINDVNYAKDGCRRCTVRKECLYSAIYERETFIGVNAGYSEIEYMIRTWEPVEEGDETNWRKSDRLIQVLFREII